MIDLDMIRAECESGLPNEQERLQRSRENWDFYSLHFDPYPTREEEERIQGRVLRRTSPFLRRVVDCLTMHLYRRPPRRSLGRGAKAAQAWLEAIYAAEQVDLLWKQADRLALIGDLCAFRVVGRRAKDQDGIDPQRPVKIDVWGGHELAVWSEDGDPLEPEAVCAIDRCDGQVRYRLYTGETIDVFVTDKYQGQTSGARAARWESGGPNPYGRIPFVLVHALPPVSTLHDRGPGTYLREVNDDLNYRLTELGDNLRFLGKPRGVAQNVAPDWRPPHPWKPGEFVTVPPLVPSRGADPAMGSLSYLTPPLDFSNVWWTDLDHWIEHALHFSGVPSSVVRAVARHAASGAAILAEQAPLVAWAEGRQPQFARYEQALAELTLAVGQTHALVNPKPPVALSLDWPDLNVELPGPEADQRDQWLKDQGLLSQVMLCQRRLKLATREEAIAHLEQVLADEAEFGAEASPALEKMGEGAAPAGNEGQAGHRP